MDFLRKKVVDGVDELHVARGSGLLICRINGIRRSSTARECQFFT